MDLEGQAWAIEGKGAGQPQQADGVHILLFARPHLHILTLPQERHHQRALHRQCSGQVLEEFEAEKAGDDVPAVVFPLGQRACAPRNRVSLEKIELSS